MTSADFCPFSCSFQSRFSFFFELRTDLPGYSHGLSLHLPASSTLDSLWQHGLYLVMQTHPTIVSLHEIRVPRAGVLPLASFRFHLTVDTLALSYGYCCLRHSGLTPYRPCARRAQIKKPQSMPWGEQKYYEHLLAAIQPPLILSLSKDAKKLPTTCKTTADMGGCFVYLLYRIHVLLRNSNGTCTRRSLCNHLS
jgi:hypothetical protein